MCKLSNFTSDTIEGRLAIARDAITKLGVRAALLGTRPNTPPESPKWGYEGVDRPHKEVAKYRARIRFCDASTGSDVRISSTGYDDPSDAGYWYMCAHIKAWGTLSYFVNEIGEKMVAHLLKGTPIWGRRTMADNLRGIRTDENVPLC